MFRPLALFIGTRYVRTRRRSRFVSFISLSSMLGTALGVWALITVLSVMNGFHAELRGRLLAMSAHVVVEGRGRPLADWRTLAGELERVPGVRGTAPYVQGEAMITAEGSSRAAVLRGVLPGRESRVSELATHLRGGDAGVLRAGRYGIALGVELASALGVRVGDPVLVVVPQARVTPAGVFPRYRRFHVVDLFSFGVNEYDSGLAVVHVEDAARLYGRGRGVDGIRLRVADVLAAPAIAAGLRPGLPADLEVRDWTREHVTLFQAIAMEKRVMAVILFLIVAVAAFNIVATLVMVVADKRADIAILRTIGAAPGTILRIFMVQGSVLGVSGTLLGLAAGVPTALNIEAVAARLEQWLGVRFFSPDVYYISRLVADLHWRDVYLIGAGSLILTVLATVYPAMRAAAVEPAEALHYE